MGRFRTGSSASHVSMHSTMEISTPGHVNSCIKACGWARLCRNWCNCTYGIHLHIFWSEHTRVCVHSRTRVSICSVYGQARSCMCMEAHLCLCVYICLPCLDLHPHMQTWFHMHTHLDIHVKSQISSSTWISVHVHPCADLSRLTLCMFVSENAHESVCPCCSAPTQAPPYVLCLCSQMCTFHLVKGQARARILGKSCTCLIWGQLGHSSVHAVGSQLHPWRWVEACWLPPSLPMSVQVLSNGKPVIFYSCCFWLFPITFSFLLFSYFVCTLCANHSPAITHQKLSLEPERKGPKQNIFQKLFKPPALCSTLLPRLPAHPSQLSPTPETMTPSCLVTQMFSQGCNLYTNCFRVS